MTKRFKRLMAETAARWRDTLNSDAQPDVAAAKKILQAADKNATVFVADSPMQFYFGQAIIRGRLSKKRAEEFCEYFGIDSAFVSEFKRSGGIGEFVGGTPWSRHQTNSITDNLLLDHANKVWAVPRRNRAPNSFRTNELLMQTRLCDLVSLYPTFMRDRAATVESRSAEVNHVHEILDVLNFGTRAGRKTDRGLLTVLDAVSDQPQDILSNNFDPEAHRFDGVHAEFLSKMLNCKDPAINSIFEIFHVTPAVMRFNGAYLIMGKKPILRLNAENNLHSETGPAVEWADKTGLWVFDGHLLRQQGKKIVTAPETLTYAEIAELDNEEERRVAIDRFGWDRYVHDGGGKILAHAENYVDNTFEVLVQPPENKATWRAEPLRMVLACRSTGRQYFIAVPHTEEGSRFAFADDKGTKITTCKQAQNWLANGAVSEHLPYAKYALNIVGAS